MPAPVFPNGAPTLPSSNIASSSTTTSSAPNLPMAVPNHPHHQVGHSPAFIRHLDGEISMNTLSRQPIPSAPSLSTPNTTHGWPSAPLSSIVSSANPSSASLSSPIPSFSSYSARAASLQLQNLDTHTSNAQRRHAAGRHFPIRTQRNRSASHGLPTLGATMQVHHIEPPSHIKVKVCLIPSAVSTASSLSCTSGQIQKLICS